MDLGLALRATVLHLLAPFLNAFETVLVGAGVQSRLDHELNLF